MKACRTVFILGFAAVLAGACGRKGEILPPLAFVPQPVQTLTTGQRGGRMLLDWPASTAYIDGRPLPPSAATEIWVLRNTAEEANVPREGAVAGFLDKARRLAVLDVYGRPILENNAALPLPGTPPLGAFHWEWTLTPDDWKATRLIFGVRVKAGRRAYSDFVYMGRWPQQISLPPSQLRTVVRVDRIEIRWTAPDANLDGSKPPLVKGYNVYRNTPSGTPVRLNMSPVAAPYFMDRDFEFGARYFYHVAALSGAAPPYVESDDSEALEITPVDIFPPAPPAGLESVTAPGLITLIWERSPETDIAGYRVWRKAAGESEFKALTPAVIPENTFTDGAVEKGLRYDYAVSAVDRAGNESPRSAVLTEVIKDPER
jgi:hypothetical protein